MKVKVDNNWRMKRYGCNSQPTIMEALMGLEYDGDAISDSEWYASECEDRDDEQNWEEEMDEGRAFGDLDAQY